MMLRVLVLLFLLPHYFSASAATTNLLPSLINDQGHFKDPQGRIVILRGMNVGGNSKVPPFIAISSPKELDPLAQWGFNVIRLLFNWEAFELEPGVYQDSYLEHYKQIVKWANTRGLYVIVDIHQDGFSRFNLGGCGDGFPRWAVPSVVKTFPPLNQSDCKNWHLKILFDKDVKLSWWHFFENTYGIRTRYLELINRLTLTFKDFPGVVGYDLLNEPMGLEIKQISPLYQEGTQIINKNHPEAFVFISPEILTGTGMKQSDLIRPQEHPHIAYSPHYYHPTMLTLGMWKWPSIPSAFLKMRAKAESWQVPLFLGEFGINAESAQAPSYMNALYQQMETHFISGTQWNYTPHWTADKKDGWNQEDFSVVGEHGKIRRNFQIRPLVRKISGTPISYKTKVGEGIFELEFKWNHRPDLGSSEVFIPMDIFGSNIVLESSGKCEIRSQEQILVCESQEEGPQWVRAKFPWNFE